MFLKYEMGDSAEILQRLDQSQITYPVLVPNEVGYQAAKKAGAKAIAIFGAASEAFSQKNINCSIAESFTRFQKVADMAHADGIKVRGFELFFDLLIRKLRFLCHGLSIRRIGSH